MKKKVQKVVAFLVIMLSAIFIFPIVSYSPENMYRILRYRESDVNDYEIFTERTIASSTNPYLYEERAIWGLVIHIMVLFTKKNLVTPCLLVEAIQATTKVLSELKSS